MALLEDEGADTNTVVDLGGGSGRFFDRTMKDSKPHDIYASVIKNT